MIYEMSSVEVNYNFEKSVEESGGVEGEETDSDKVKPKVKKLLSLNCQNSPKLFERAAPTWWDPKFDSEVLENQLIETSQLQVQRRFRYGLIYLLLLGVAWAIYFAFTARQYWTELVIGCVAYSIFVFLIFAVTFAPFYPSISFQLSLLLTSVTCAVSLSAFFTAGPPDPEEYDPEEGVGVAAGGDISTIGMFAVAVEVIAVVYTLVPLPLYVAAASLGIYSVAFEVLSALYTRDNSLWAVLLKSLLHLVIHLIGIHIDIMSQVRMRSTFLKVCHKVLAKKELELERKLKENMIHSVMPPSVAEWLMKEGHWEEDEDERAMENGGNRMDGEPPVHRGSQDRGQIRSLFRPFHMNRMQEVSILFADICGFTRMSSNKTAERLVDLLNDLFGRFDALCEQLGCEKISTLGDCYYCVSGCPEPRPDHAQCCVEMGLAMIATIRQFDIDTGEDVNMRVGVHTGTILCGIVGTKRIKFDVWSNDVRLANTMESTGAAGRVHISNTTYSYVHNYYNVEETEHYNDMKTYFILGHKEGVSSNSTYCHKMKLKSRIPIIDLPGIITRDSEDDDTPSLSLRRSWSADCNVNGSSRKDSGIRSQRSNSTQTTHILSLLNEELQPKSDAIGHRVSGYYTASQASIEDPALQPLSVESNSCLKRGGLHSFRRLRQKSDRQLIRGLREDESHKDYFLHPPLNTFSLLFTDAEVEKDYRRLVHRQVATEAQTTLASPTFNTYFDVLVALFTYVVVALACFVTFGAHILWLLFCLGATSWQILVVVLCLKQFLNPRGSSVQLRNLYSWCTKWWPWHVFGTLLVSLPMMSILTNFTCQTFIKYPLRTDFFFFVFIVSTLHFCNFAQLSGWIKSLVASVGVIAVLAMLESDVCKPFQAEVKKNLTKSKVIYLPVEENSTDMIATSSPISPIQVSFTGSDPILYEVILDVLSLLFLVWFLNREFEISYRMHFHGGLLAARDWRKVQMLKDQADWLLHNIIPRHVAEHLKSDSKYSENHRRVGILFATIVNFNELYDESYRGGKECLRVLNELIADFDQLVSQVQFKNVDKIKTIGTTFMAASGLNRQMRLEATDAEGRDTDGHLCELMDFGFAMIDAIDEFNNNLLEFNLQLRLGFNFGEVTAGVIGTTKLYYDIWGDAVNIASRMDSTGYHGRHIQVPEHCVPFLQNYFLIEFRDTLYVKGKDDMRVYLVKGRQEQGDSKENKREL